MAEQQQLEGAGRRDKRVWAGHHSREGYAKSLDGWRPFRPGVDADAAQRAGYLLAEAVREAFAKPHARGIRKRLLEALDAWDVANDPDQATTAGGFTRGDWK